MDTKPLVWRVPHAKVVRRKLLQIAFLESEANDEILKKWPRVQIFWANGFFSRVARLDRKKNLGLIQSRCSDKNLLQLIKAAATTRSQKTFAPKIFFSTVYMCLRCIIITNEHTKIFFAHKIFLRVELISYLKLVLTLKIFFTRPKIILSSYKVIIYHLWSTTSSEFLLYSLRSYDNE